MRTSAPEAGAVRELPEFKARRTTQPQLLGGFAAQLAALTDGPPAAARTPRTTQTREKVAPKAGPPPLDPADLAAAKSGGAPTPERAELLRRADGLLGIPYVWGGDSPKGLDCSSFISRIWGVSRQTTDTLPNITVPIAKDELKAGDIMNLPTWKDPEGYGHVRMFDQWANPEKTQMWVYEQTTATGESVRRVIDYDARYEPRRWKELVGNG